MSVPRGSRRVKITLQDLLEDEPCTFSYYNYMYIHSPSKDEYTMLCHQYRYRKVPVTLAQDIWANEVAPDGSRSKMHIIITHTHIEQTGWIQTAGGAASVWAARERARRPSTSRRGSACSGSGSRVS